MVRSIKRPGAGVKLEKIFFSYSYDNNYFANELKNVVGLSGSFGIIRFNKKGYLFEFFLKIGARYTYTGIKTYSSLTKYESGILFEKIEGNYFKPSVNIGIKLGYSK